MGDRQNEKIPSNRERSEVMWREIRSDVERGAECDDQCSVDSRDVQIVMNGVFVVACLLCLVLKRMFIGTSGTADVEVRSDKQAMLCGARNVTMRRR